MEMLGPNLLSESCYTRELSNAAYALLLPP